MATATIDASPAAVSSAIAQAFPFSVGKFPLQGPDGMRTPHYGLFRDDNSECVGVACKKGYEPHTRDDVAAMSEAAAAAFNAQVKVTTHWADGHTVILGPTDDYRREIFGRDTVWPRFVLRAGYDGSAFSASLGLYRDACRNLLMVRPARGIVSAKLRHTVGLRDRMPELIDQFRQLATSWDSVVETAQAMRQREIGVADFVRSIYRLPENASARQEQSFTERARRIVARIARDRHALGVDMGNLERATAWEAFNAVQGYIQHDQRRHGRPSDVARALMAWNDPTVDRAFSLAMAG